MNEHLPRKFDIKTERMKSKNHFILLMKNKISRPKSIKYYMIKEDEYVGIPFKHFTAMIPKQKYDQSIQHPSINKSGRHKSIAKTAKMLDSPVQVPNLPNDKLCKYQEPIHVFNVVPPILPPGLDQQFNDPSFFPSIPNFIHTINLPKMNNNWNATNSTSERNALINVGANPDNGVEELPENCSAPFSLELGLVDELLDDESDFMLEMTDI